VVCESQVYNAVVDWVKYDVNSRRHSLNKLIKNVRCHLIKPEFISRQLENCEIVRSTCYDYLTKVLEDLKAFIPFESKSRQLDIPQVIYVIKFEYGVELKKSLESTEFSLSETDVRFKLPRLCIPYDFRCAVINGFIYVLNKFDCDIDRYDPISNQWKKCKSLDRIFFLPEMVAIHIELYVIEGFGENILMKYDPIADEWTQRASLNKKRRDFGCTVFNRKLYVVGGDVVTHHRFAFVDMYDPLNNQWTSVTPMLTSRSGPAAVTLGNYIYAIGGSNDEYRYLKTVERYDVLNDKWEFVASMKYERIYPTAVVFNKKIYVFGGRCDFDVFVEFVECFDEKTNEWNEVAKMNEKFVDQVIVSYQPCVPDICKNIPF